MPVSKELKALVDKIIDEKININDLTKEEQKLLPKLFVMVEQRKSRTQQLFWNIHFKFHDKLKISKTLTENEYNVLCLDFPKEFQQQGSTFVIQVPVVLTEGKFTDDESYYRVSGNVGKTYYTGFFLNSVEKRLLVDYGLTEQFVHREKRIDKNQF